MNLAKSAMLVSVTIINGGLLGERRDKTATGYVERKFKLHERRAKASKFLIDRKHPKVKAVVAASQRVREVLYKYTMPWGDDKTRLLPVSVHEEFQKKMQDAQAELHQAWDDYLQVYPSLVADSERELGNLFDRSDYPSVKKARDMFSFKITYWPLPSKGHFIANIADEAAAKATADMSMEIETRLAKSAESLVQRGKEVVAVFLERLNNFKSKKDGKIIRDSLVNNCAEIGRLIDDMNLTDNEDIKLLARSIMRLGRYTAERIRDDRILRDNLKQKAKEILATSVSADRLDKEVSEMVAEAAEYEWMT